VLDDDSEHGGADLGVTCLIGLYAAHHFLEHVVVDLICEGGQAHELQIGKSGLKDKVGGQCKFDRIRANQQLVHDVSRGNRYPIVGVIESVGPVKLGIPANQFVHDEQRDLCVA
jgi:hypothetical protein